MDYELSFMIEKTMPAESILSGLNATGHILKRKNDLVIISQCLIK